MNAENYSRDFLGSLEAEYILNNVVLLAINAKYVHSSLSVWVIAGGISRYAQLPHNINIVEATINQPVLEIVEAVAEFMPEIIGVSTYIWNAGKLPGLLSLLRTRLPDAVFVLGGPEASNNVDFWLKNGADHVLCGEGEYTFPEFLNTRIPGDFKNSDTKVSACIESEQLSPVYENPVDPYTGEYLNTLSGRLVYIEASRGCPYMCSFCLSAGSGVRFFPLDAVKNQIYTLSRSGIKTLKFVDRTFNCNAERAFELFKYVIGLDTNCCFHFEAAADLFDDLMLSLLKTAPPGRIQFEIGLQSFFEPALNASCRHMDIIKAESNIRSLVDMKNIHLHVDLIAGLPYETLDDFMDSFDRAYFLNTHTLQLGFLKLLHGSKLREQAESLGIQYSRDPPYEITSSPWLSPEDLQILIHTENALRHTRNKGRFISTIEYVLSVSGMRPFTLMASLGTAVPNHGVQLEEYVISVYRHFASLPFVDMDILQDRLVFDWLGMVKGKNKPAVLKNTFTRCGDIQKAADKIIGHKLRREEHAVLRSGKNIFVDRNDYDPVTGLYRVHTYDC